MGLATEGARTSIRYGFEKLALERIISIALPQNIASRRIMEKCGLTLRGETRWKDLDVVWYAVDRWEWLAEASRVLSSSDPRPGPGGCSR